MACPTCGSVVIFGGIKNGPDRYCSQKCYESGEIGRSAQDLPLEVVETFARELNRGPCPKCDGPGPVDVHKSYSVYSIIFYTSWKTSQHLMCKSCALKQQAVDLAGSMLLGWWGLPFGLIVTPIQILANVVAMVQTPGRDGPTKNLMEKSRLMIAAQQAAARDYQVGIDG